MPLLNNKLIWYNLPEIKIQTILFKQQILKII